MAAEAEPTDICWFVSRQVTIKTRYHLAVTQDEKDEMIRGLSSGLCDGSRLKPLPPSEFKAPEAKPIGEPKPSPKPEPQPSPKRLPSQILSRRRTQSRTGARLTEMDRVAAAASA